MRDVDEVVLYRRGWVGASIETGDPRRALPVVAADGKPVLDVEGDLLIALYLAAAAAAAEDVEAWAISASEEGEECPEPVLL